MNPQLDGYIVSISCCRNVKREQQVLDEAAAGKSNIKNNEPKTFKYQIVSRI